MPFDCTVVVATFGDRSWSELAAWRAVPSVEAEGVPVVVSHADTLQAARNDGLDQVRTGFVVFLDADDELEPGYMRAMASGTADLRAPAVRYLTPGTELIPSRVPRVAGHSHDCSGDCLPWGNWLVIGAAARVDVLRGVGGFADWPVYEDWDLWLRCWQAGASVEAIPSAVYVAHVRQDSRNRSGSAFERFEVHRQIARANGVPIP